VPGRRGTTSFRRWSVRSLLFPDSEHPEALLFGGVRLRKGFSLASWPEFPPDLGDVSFFFLAMLGTSPLLFFAAVRCECSQTILILRVRQYRGKFPPHPIIYSAFFFFPPPPVGFRRRCQNQIHAIKFFFSRNPYWRHLLRSPNWVLSSLGHNVFFRPEGPFFFSDPGGGRTFFFESFTNPFRWQFFGIKLQAPSFFPSTISTLSLLCVLCVSFVGVALASFSHGKTNPFPVLLQEGPFSFLTLCSRLLTKGSFSLFFGRGSLSTPVFWPLFSFFSFRIPLPLESCFRIHIRGRRPIPSLL